MIINSDRVIKIKVMFSTLTSLNKPKEIDEDYVEKTLETILNLYNEDLNQDEINQLKRDIYTEFQIKQNDGILLLDDYEHESWYINNKENFSKFHWDRYKSHLIGKNFPPKIVENLEKTLDEIVDSLGDPNSNSPFLRRGLVIGDVQSGKTSNYIGLINKAADAGYKIIILLTGTIESLRKQTQIRVEEGFVGFDSIGKTRVGVGLDNKEMTVISMTSRQNDFTKNLDKNTMLSLDGNNGKIIFVIKKNTSILNKLFKAFKSINTSKLNPKIDHSLLLIDDEADNASINTNKPENDPTKTNEAIRKILNLFTKSNYVGFTATPFANVFIDPTTTDEMIGQDLFPENFIYSLEAPSNYIGPSKIFSNEENSILKYIEDEDLEHIFSHRHKKDWNENVFFDSLNEAIYCFLIANVIRDYKGDVYSHRSMLVNVSRFVKVQFNIKDIIEEILDQIITNIKYHIHNEDESKNKIISEIYNVWKNEFHNHIKWEDIKNRMYESIKDIKIIVVNSSKNSEKLDYEDNEDGLRVIAIGGLALSRGLTLEGLMTSYFYRNTSTFDVLMQMGRWFGYRPNYEDLCRIYITKESAKWYKEISEATELLKKDIIEMRLKNKKPLEFGIRVKNDSEELGITSKNKMRSTSFRKHRITYFGEVFEAPYLDASIELNNHHYSLVKKLVSLLPNMNNEVKQPYFKNINSKHIIDFIEKLEPSYYSVRFDTKQILTFLNSEKTRIYKNWDVLFMQGSKDNENLYKLREDVEIIPIKRSFDIIDNNIIRVSGSRARLGAKEDTKNGLSKDQITKAEEWSKDNNQGISAKTYLVEDRNPLLIIYLIDLLDKDGQYYEKEFNIKLMETNKPLVGFSVAFPRNERVDSNKVETYVVNNNANYFVLQSENESQEDLDDEDE